MMKHYWFVSVGPLDDSAASALVDEMISRHGGRFEVELLNRRAWFARALDVSSVRDSLAVLRAGLLDESLSLEARQSVMGIVSDMETWLDREFDPTATLSTES